MIRFALTLLIFVLWWALPAHAQSPAAYVSGAEQLAIAPITSTTVGVSLAPSIRKGITITSLPTSTVTVYIARLDGVCASAMTAPVGDPVYPGGSYTALISDGWAGQFCAVLGAAGTVNLKAVRW